MFSFVKEMTDESAALLKTLDARQADWRRSPGVLVWAIVLHDEPHRVRAWAEHHGLKNISVAATAPNHPKLAVWNIDPQADNTHVLTCRGKLVVGVYVHLKADDAVALEAKLHKLVVSKKRD
jgi:hypothetical protein